MANALAQKARNEMAAARRNPRNAMLDFARGALMGATTDVLGYPVDLATMAMRPFGYNALAPVGGSDWLAERLTSPTGSIAETAGRTVTGMLTPGPEDMLRLAGVLNRAPVQELTTYHGSPHRINNVDEANPLGKFDLSKIGTGEGGQSYGHGIYLAENPGVAKTYARPASAQGDLIALARSKSGGDKDVARRMIGEWAADAGDDYTRAQYRATAENFDSLWEQNGHFYTVDLPDEHIAKMLDWDAPLQKQPAEVQDVVRDMLKQQGYLRPNDNGPRQLTEAYKAWRIERGGMAEGSGGGSIYGLISKQLGGDEAASAMLRQRGISGIKYFDQGSRDAGRGTRNFVIFDPDIAKILKRE